MRKKMTRQGTGFLWLQISGWLLLGYLVYAQAIPAFDYELGVTMGTQESAEQITQVGTAFWFGFALADLVVYIPLLLAGLIGVWKRAMWARIVMAAALGITVYWPIVSLATVAKARNAPGWNLTNESDYWIVLPVLVVWGIWGLWLIARADSRE